MGCVLLNLSKRALRQPEGAPGGGHGHQLGPVRRRSSTRASTPPRTGRSCTGSPYYLADNGYPVVQPVEGQAAGPARSHQETGHPVTFTLNHVPDPNTTKIAEYLQQQFQNVGMTVTLSPVQQAQIINTALLGKFQAQVWRQFGAVDPDLNYIFWSPTNDQLGLLHQHGPQHRPEHGDRAHPRVASRPTSRRPGRRLPAGEPADGLGHPLHLDRPRPSGRSGPSPRWRTSTIPPPRPAATAFGFITGAIWPTQIWLNS